VQHGGNVGEAPILDAPRLAADEVVQQPADSSIARYRPALSNLNQCLPGRLGDHHTGLPQLLHTGHSAGHPHVRPGTGPPAGGDAVLPPAAESAFSGELPDQRRGFKCQDCCSSRRSATRPAVESATGPRGPPVLHHHPGATARATVHLSSYVRTLLPIPRRRPVSS